MTRHAVHTVFTYYDGTCISGPATHVEIDNDGTPRGLDAAVNALTTKLAGAAGAHARTLYNDPGRFPVLISYSSGSYDADGVYSIDYGLE